MEKSQLGLLAQFVAGGADYGGFVLPMTVDASFHGVVDFLGENVALVDKAVASCAVDFGGEVAGVAEEDVVGEAVDAAGGKPGRFRLRGVAGAAGGRWRKSGSLAL